MPSGDWELLPAADDRGVTTPDADKRDRSKSAAAAPANAKEDCSPRISELGFVAFDHEPHPSSPSRVGQIDRTDAARRVSRPAPLGELITKA
ncbi:hypothetical protein MKK84_13230 [Methylobacterium sp. E-065]|uniref:hypothetical protein n=1 Tax=Methylobacterium sp. E-065 TaxID=2836583 RepID=UPI001FBAE77F|nr:hypothetical protein [Methylobacterium sp. E-065]MCJ2018382.1 hypothetical protein [Methylobacterium sp. E-065]